MFSIESARYCPYQGLTYIVDIPKIDAGQMDVYYTHTDINKTFTCVACLHLIGIGKQKQTKCAAILFKSKNVFYKTDETRLNQILINQIGSASKYPDREILEFKCLLRVTE